MSINLDLLHNVDNQLRDRYTRRLNRFGHDPRTLGWDTCEHQYIRYASACRFIPETTNSIIDIGCGLADFYRYFTDRHRNIQYTGIDINPELLSLCKQTYPHCSFHNKNILSDTINDIQSEWAVMFGVLNFKFNEFNNIDFAKAMISRAFDFISDGLIVDMLSDNRHIHYPKEDFVYYYKPEDILKIAFDITDHVTLVHDYAAIPQREFSLILRKESCKL